MLYKYKLYIDGDAIADLVFAYKMNKSVKPIPDDVYFTTTLPIIFGNTGIEAILFMFKMSFFNTFFVARIVEMLIYCVLIDRILRKIDLGKKWIIWGILIFPTITFMYMVYLGGYYLWTITTYLILLCIYKIYYLGKWKNYIFCFITFFSFSLGLLGIKTLMWVIAPLGFALIIDIFWRKNKCYIMLGASTVLPAVIGYVINEKILLDKYGVGSRTSLQYAPLNDIFNRFVMTLNQILALMGWQEQVRLISIEGIMNIVVLLFLLVICFFMILTVRNMHKIDAFDRIIFLSSVISFVISLFVLVFTKADISAAYLVPSVWALLFWCCIFWHKYLGEDVAVRAKVIFICMLLFFYVFSWRNMYTVFVANREYLGEEQKLVLDILEGQGYEYGYATFWNSMPIVAGSNMEIESTNISISEEGIYYFRWGSPKEFYDKEYYDGEVFLVLMEDEKEIFNKMLV